MKQLIVLLVLLVLLQPAAAQTFSVIHEKTLWRDGRGTLEITEEGIEYRAAKSKDSRVWRYADIQYLDRISEKEFILLSYEDQRLQLGRDRQYHFRITEGALSDETFRILSARLDRPVTNRQPATPAGVEYRVPVKHRHTFGGCEGTLIFTRQAVHYVTDHAEDAREWRLGRDVASVWSADPYRLDIHAYDNNRREFSRTRTYRFHLKEALDAEFYRNLKLRLYGLETVHLR